MAMRMVYNAIFCGCAYCLRWPQNSTNDIGKLWTRNDVWIPFNDVNACEMSDTGMKRRRAKIFSLVSDRRLNEFALLCKSSCVRVNGTSVSVVVVN